MCLCGYAVRMSILSSLAWGFATLAYGDATVTYSAIMATLTQVLRIVQVLVVVGLFYGVFRLWWAFIKRATTFEPVAPAPVVEPELVTLSDEPDELTLSEVWFWVSGVVGDLGYDDRVKPYGVATFRTDAGAILTICEVGGSPMLNPTRSSKWALYVTGSWSDFRKGFGVNSYEVREAVRELVRAHAQAVAHEAFVKAFVPNCPKCDTQYDTYDFNEANEPCNFGACPNPKCPTTEYEL